MARNECRGIAREEHDCTLDVILATAASYRDTRLEGAQLLRILPDVIHHVREKRPRRNCIHSDPVGCEFYGEVLGQCQHCALAGVVRHDRLVLFSGTAECGNGSDVDDAASAVVSHVTGGALREQEEAADVEVEDAVPARERILEGRRGPGGTGVVHEDLKPRSLREDRVHECLYLVRLGDVGLEGHRSPARTLPDERRRFLTRGRLAGGKKDIRPSLRQSDCQVSSDAAAAARNERGLARKVEESVDVHTPA